MSSSRVLRPQFSNYWGIESHIWPALERVLALRLALLDSKYLGPVHGKHHGGRVDLHNAVAGPSETDASNNRSSGALCHWPQPTSLRLNILFAIRSKSSSLLAICMVTCSTTQPAWSNTPWSASAIRGQSHTTFGFTLC